MSLLSYANAQVLCSHQSYQLAEDLGRAFADKVILLTSLDAEANVPAGPLKVNGFYFLMNILCFPTQFENVVS